ncbi:MAG: Serine/threonine-protein kinase PrkC [Candidatus Accumulibacter sp. BA-94]|uniref:serine/threonine protein kinase n=1 Tax=Accumulibacter sp. TaxID=2053492 RepID=UPI00044C3F6B|nr:serine/threonine protein kinase [Accumulibacter sp.]EXI85649.1 MAG: Serine/threonine-protein kinase PrkC [Candidatus Accumulibacter sp. BA-94]MBL8391253.1 HDOD domain-containing protein [Accumulibacter sp.]HRD87659.1 HDOD domain-containing protein [Accumulibacter sp.]
MSRKVGRFEILRELGRGAQSVVYLARDPHLQRQVAIKTLHFARPDAQQNSQLLAEARMVSQLRHPNIVPIFEAAEEQGDLYLVFQLVPGRNLAEHLQITGALPPARAIPIMLAILDALAHAHAAGIIHRDLKPSNILIDDDGVARVMDFGIAARAEARSTDGGQLTGTPAYMAPEYISERRSSERSDIFAAGLVLYELLAGRRALAGRDVPQVMRRIIGDDIRLPAETIGLLDERLVHLVHRALERDPANRYESAAQMREALDDHLHPPPVGEANDARQSTIDFLLRRMRHKSDFPALSESVSAINRITTAENQSVSQLANTILKDFSLTNKILRMVNSAYYQQAGGGNISTVSRAVVVLGLDAVRSMAITVLLLEHLQNTDNADQLKDEFLRANLAGVLARDIGSSVAGRPESEEAFICSMFHNLGRLLSQYYFPEESAEIRRVLLQRNCAEDAAAQQVLGISFADLGMAIAQTWGFPRQIVNSMRRLPAGSVRRPLGSEDRLRVLAALSNELCGVIAESSGEQQPKELRRIAGRFADAIALDEKELRQAVDRSLAQLVDFARNIRLNLQQTRFGRQLKAWGASQASPAVPPLSADDGLGDSVLPELAVVPVVAQPAAEAVAAGPAGESAADTTDASARTATLLAGIQDVSNALVSDCRLNDVLRITLETMYRAMGFRRVILCVRDQRSNSMLGRFGFGPDVVEVAKRFRFSLVFSPDIFHAALANGVDILISDTSDPKIAARIPDWFRRAVAAETFVVLPLCIKRSAVAMIYADRARAGEISISGQDLSLLRTLRNQAVLAIKQSG